MLWFKRSDHPSETDLSAYLDGEVTSRRARELAAHLDGCASCPRLLDELRAAKSLAGVLPRLAPSHSFVLGPEHARARPAVAPRPAAFSFAPAVALTLLVALLAVDFLPRSSEDSSAGLPRDEAPASKAAGERAANDRPDFQAPPGAPTPAAARSAAVPPAGASAEAQTAPQPAAPAPVQPPVGAFDQLRSTQPTPAPPSTTATQVREETDKGSGISLLRALEGATGAAFIASLLVWAWPRIKRREGTNR